MNDNKYFKIRFSGRPGKSAGRNYMMDRFLGGLEPGEYYAGGEYYHGLVFTQETFNATEVQAWLERYGKPFYFESCEAEERILERCVYRPI